MMQKTEAIVLHAFRLGERKLVADLFCRELGRLSFVVTLGQSQRSRMRKQYFQPMTLLEVEADVRQREGLQRLRDVRLLTAYQDLPFQPEKLAQTLFVAEFLYHALRSEQANDPLFRYIAGSMQWLDAASTGYANFHLTFLLHLSRFLGFYPLLDTAGAGEVFDLRAGSFSAHVPLHTDYLPPAESAQLRQLMRMDFPNMHLFRLSRQQRNSIVERLLHYYSLHLPQFPPLRSLDVLQQLF